MKDRKNTEPPPEARWITWEIGTAELQRSVMAGETFDDLLAGETHVEQLRNNIRRRRKLIVRESTGQWSTDPSERFVNEHAWVLSLMNQYRDDNRRKSTDQANLFASACSHKAAGTDRRNEADRTARMEGRAASEAAGLVTYAGIGVHATRYGS